MYMTQGPEEVWMDEADTAGCISVSGEVRRRKKGDEKQQGSNGSVNAESSFPSAFLTGLPSNWTVLGSPGVKFAISSSSTWLYYGCHTKLLCKVEVNSRGFYGSQGRIIKVNTVFYSFLSPFNRISKHLCFGVIS